MIIIPLILCLITQSQCTLLNFFLLQNQEDAALNELYLLIQNNPQGINCPEIKQKRNLYIRSLKIKIARLKTQKKILKKESINTKSLRGYLEINTACILNQICLNKMNTGKCGESHSLYYSKLIALSTVEMVLFLDGIYHLFCPDAKTKTVKHQLDHDQALLAQLEMITTE